MSEHERPGLAPAGLEVPALPGQSLGELSLEALRAYRAGLAEEEERVSYWRRLVHARIDLLQAEVATAGPLPLATVQRVLGDTGSGRARRALVRVRAAEPLPALPVLDEIWSAELDPGDESARGAALERLSGAEQQLTTYRRALHARIDDATAELIERYRAEPSLALVALRDSGPPPRSRG